MAQFWENNFGGRVITPSISEIIWVKNVRAIVVFNEIIKKICPKNLKKIVGAVWELPAK